MWPNRNHYCKILTYHEHIFAGTTSGCSPLSAPVHGAMDDSGSTVSEMKATFSCDGGYILEGAAQATCPCGGIWDANVPICIKCRSLSVNNAIPSIIGLQTGETVTYTCGAGFEHTGGDLTRTCQDDGTLQGTDPVCSSKSIAEYLP